MTSESQKQERRGAKVYKGTQNSGSGNTNGHKNDVRTPGYSIEFKTTRQKSYSLKLADLKTAAKNALLSGREVLFAIDFQEQTSSGRIDTHRYVVMPEWEFLDMTGRLDKAESDVGYLMRYLPEGEYLD